MFQIVILRWSKITFTVYYTYIFVYIQCYLALVMSYQNYFNTANVLIYFLQQISHIDLVQ